MFLLLQNMFYQVWNQSLCSCTRNGSLSGRTLGRQVSLRIQFYQTDSGNAFWALQFWNLGGLIFTYSQQRYLSRRCRNALLGVRTESTRSCTCSLIYLILTGDILKGFSLLTLLERALTAGSRQSSLLFSCDRPSAMGSFSKAHQELKALSTSSNQDI